MALFSFRFTSSSRFALPPLHAANHERFAAKPAQSPSEREILNITDRRKSIIWSVGCIAIRHRVLPIVSCGQIWAAAGTYNPIFCCRSDVYNILA
ncbi:hypothetical protein [Sinorhizobium medicae]|uniref:hypothetical protein n=1 Tax=Sinorhizobium medicae TaxID=110321 RepID=UPI000FDA7572|nr:hypothetical protein [Sinorhizobium medicae]MDX0425183.1 hypothetical protein [Sinorhizobium medicae]MDX0523222.1 hypothetical protein [Sinorhizobium medicae]MDX0548191.1 hypothetical protein [Sinorhizobium medicae]MDX0635065.1 hypothetical protein [Sinorhizobium medicae]MDX0715331.1 hypothetical protein [Sinorhizobium medicae]